MTGTERLFGVICIWKLLNPGRFHLCIAGSFIFRLNNSCVSGHPNAHVYAYLKTYLPTVWKNRDAKISFFPVYPYVCKRINWVEFFYKSFAIHLYEHNINWTRITKKKFAATTQAWSCPMSERPHRLQRMWRSDDVNSVCKANFAEKIPIHWDENEYRSRSAYKGNCYWNILTADQTVTG